LHSLFSLPGGRVPHQGLELVKPGVSSREILLRKRQDLASSWGISIVHSRMFSRRRQDGCTRPLRCSRVTPGMRKAKVPTKGLSTLNSMAFGLAVYASQCGLPSPHARLASGRWSGVTGRAFHPQDSAERFPSCFLHLIPLSQASCRNLIRRAFASLSSRHFLFPTASNSILRLFSRRWALSSKDSQTPPARTTTATVPQNIHGSVLFLARRIADVSVVRRPLPSGSDTGVVFDTAMEELHLGHCTTF